MASHGYDDDDFDIVDANEWNQYDSYAMRRAPQHTQIHMTQQMTTKVAPAYDGRTSFFAFEDAIDDWCDITELEPEKRGPALRNRLEGDAQQYKRLLDREMLRDPYEGVAYFKRFLRPHFIKGAQNVFLYRFMQFMKFNRGTMDLQKWMTRFQLTGNRLIESWMDLLPEATVTSPEAILFVQQRRQEHERDQQERADVAAASGTPNSGHSRKLKFLRLLCAGLLFQMPLFQTSWSGGEGCDFATEVTGAPMTWDEALVHQFGAKQRGTQPTMSSGHPWPTKDSVQKRSIRRAYKRALRDGTSWYRGRCYAVQDFNTMIPSLAKGSPPINVVGTKPPKRTQDLQTCNRKHQHKRYLRYLCWNGSGLSNHKLDELKVWCSEQGIDILILTETRWRYSNEWMDPHWMYLHTGCSSQPGAGIMLLISNSVCTHHDLRWHEVVPGRLVHVQIRLRQRCLDIIACYQHTFSGTKVKQAARQEWWSCLDRYLGTLPKRHVLLMAGDFNCRLPTLKGLVGCDDFRWGHSLQKGSPHPDEGLFTALVKAHQLVALNSWNPSLGPTFSGVNGRSRIDFAFTRLPLADGHAKDIKYLTQASFLNIPHVGHFPILGQIRKMWIPPVAAVHCRNLDATTRVRPHGHDVQQS